MKRQVVYITQDELKRFIAKQVSSRFFTVVVKDVFDGIIVTNGKNHPHHYNDIGFMVFHTANTNEQLYIEFSEILQLSANGIDLIIERTEK